MDYISGMVKTAACDRPRAEADIDLVRLMAAGDGMALEELYLRHGPGLLAYLVGRLGERGLAEEVLQNVMLAAWRGAPGFRGDCQVRTWLLTIARRLAINAYHRQRTSTDLPIEAARNLPDQNFPEWNPEPALDQLDEKRELLQAVSDLPDELRETLELVFFHGLSGAEAARVLGVASGTVKSRLHRAKNRLEKWFREREAGGG
jgi:RNA polymerase sigma-70 factor, ECF subfamily